MCHVGGGSVHGCSGCLVKVLGWWMGFNAALQHELMWPLLLLLLLLLLPPPAASLPSTRTCNH